MVQRELKSHKKRTPHLLAKVRKQDLIEIVDEFVEIAMSSCLRYLHGFLESARWLPQLEKWVLVPGRNLG